MQEEIQYEFSEFYFYSNETLLDTVEHGCVSGEMIDFSHLCPHPWVSPPPLHTFRSQRKWTDYRWAFSPGSIKNNLFLPDDFIVMRKGNLVLCILTQNGHNCTIILNWIDAGHSGVIKKTHNTIGDENLRSVEISLLGEIGTRWTRRIYFQAVCVPVLGLKSLSKNRVLPTLLADWFNQSPLFA